jgi:hypothetical protein
MSLDSLMFISGRSSMQRRSWFWVQINSLVSILNWFTLQYFTEGFFNTGSCGMLKE